MPDSELNTDLFSLCSKRGKKKTQEDRVSVFANKTHICIYFDFFKLRTG